MDATTGAEVAGDSFHDLRVLLYDLRSPLAAARMGAELLIRLDLSEKQNQRVARNVLAPQCGLRKFSLISRRY